MKQPQQTPPAPDVVRPETPVESPQSDRPVGIPAPQPETTPSPGPNETPSPAPPEIPAPPPTGAG